MDYNFLDNIDLIFAAMQTAFTDYIKKVTSANEVVEKETIQSLWSGYGKIVRYEARGGEVSSVVIKHIQLTGGDNHPRGWNSDIGHQRKLKSYEVETSWYKTFSENCDKQCRVPKCLGVAKADGTIVIVLEDIDAAGFPVRKTVVNLSEIKTCLLWLASFHATFMNVKPQDLWPVGTYWHLATRPEELEVLDDTKLKFAAPSIDKLLNECTFQTLVHGDAKLANFCFSDTDLSVSAVDFQYVGGGCGMKDVAYFLGSCLNDNECEIHEKELLDHYFKALNKALVNKKSEVNFSELEKEWRVLFPIAWTDFHRFLKGWSPGHWKLTSYSERMAQKVIKQIENTPETNNIKY